MNHPNYGSHLKYLDVQFVSERPFSFHHLFNHWYVLAGAMPLLRTLILTFTPHDSMRLDILTDHLTLIPVLQRLEITAHEALLDATIWQECLETSLPSLTHFRLKSTTSRIKHVSIDTLLASFETPFWIAKGNFYLIITDHRRIQSNGFYLPEKRDDDENELSQPVFQWRIVPARARVDDRPTRDIISFGMTSAFKYLSDYYYFKNIKHLFVYDLDTSLVECLVRSMNCGGIEHLDVSSFNHRSNAMPALLSELRCIISLRIEYQHLFAYQDTYSTISMGIKYLDISVDEHRFSRKDIIDLCRLFPQLNHLAINTKDLSHIPLLKTYLPDLRSLTFAVDDQTRPLPQTHRLTRQTEFCFKRSSQWMIIWIDDDALDETRREAKWKLWIFFGFLFFFEIFRAAQLYSLCVLYDS